MGVSDADWEAMIGNQVQSQPFPKFSQKLKSGYHIIPPSKKYV